MNYQCTSKSLLLTRHERRPSSWKWSSANSQALTSKSRSIIDVGNVLISFNTLIAPRIILLLLYGKVREQKIKICRIRYVFDLSKYIFSISRFRCFFYFILYFFRNNINTNCHRIFYFEIFSFEGKSNFLTYLYISSFLYILKYRYIQKRKIIYMCRCKSFNCHRLIYLR